MSGSSVLATADRTSGYGESSSSMPGRATACWKSRHEMVIDVSYDLITFACAIATQALGIVTCEGQPSRFGLKPSFFLCCRGHWSVRIDT
jgi:hypothetical protein